MPLTTSIKGELSKLSFHCYGVEIDYNRGPCEREECDHDYGRCYTISDTSVKEVDYEEVLKTINGRLELKDPIDLYCLDRLGRVHNLYEKDSYYIETCGGYYGEEIDGIYLESIDSFVDDLTKVLTLTSTKEKLEYLLKREYGYLLEELKDKDYEIKYLTSEHKVDLESQGYKKIDVSNYKVVNRLTAPQGIVKENHNLVRVIDGHHRILKNMQEGGSFPVFMIKDKN